ncbi:MAG: metallophosphoesterase [Planctomycetota bacterium]
MRVLIVGDVHGRHQALAAELRRVQSNYRIAAAIQVGDFGLTGPAMEQLGGERVRFPVPLHVIDGNHEDHAWLRRALRSGAAAAWAEEFNLVYQPRPSLAHFGSSTAGFMGGALHVDRPQRRGLLGGIPNYILRRQRAEAAALFNRTRPVLIVTHSCPTRIGIGLRGTPGLALGVNTHITEAGFDPGAPDDRGEAELERLWKELEYRPRAWVFGHFHRMHQAVIEDTQFICVDAKIDAPGRTLVIWDTEEQRLLACPADPGR